MDFGTILNLATTAAVVGGVAFGGWQLRMAARNRTTQISLSLMQTLYSRDLIDGVVALRDVPEGLSLKQLQEHLGDNWPYAFRAFVTMDGIGLLVFRREIDPGFADDFFHHTVVTVWAGMSAAIRDVRAERQDESVGEWLQWLAESQDKLRKNGARKPAYLSS